jgi:putative ABC transport system permease protein
MNQNTLTGTPRAADLWGLAFSATRQQKVRTALTLVGIVVGTFTLVVSLAVWQGVDRAIVALFHQDDRLRKISVTRNFTPDSEDIPATEREPIGRMSDAKRARLRKALARNWRGIPVRVNRRRLDADAVHRLEALDHVVRVEPLLNIYGEASLDGKTKQVDAASVMMGSRFFADRLLAGRLFTPHDRRVAIVHEYLLYRWGLTDEESAAASIGRTFRLEHRSSPPYTVDLFEILSQRGMVGPERRPVLESGLKRLAALVRFLPIPRDERDALRTLFDRISTTTPTGTERVFAESFTFVGIIRERDEKDAQPSLMGEWNIRDSDILLPAVAAGELYLRSPVQAEEGFYQVVVTVDDEAQVNSIAARIAAMGYIVFSFASIIAIIRTNVRLITFAVSAVAVVALVVAAIGITNTMIMSVLERTHEIGIMKALGARDRDVRRVSLVEGTVLGAFGSGLGLALG